MVCGTVRFGYSLLTFWGPYCLYFLPWSWRKYDPSKCC